MGINLHGLNFLRHARGFGAFGRTVTLGRQELHLNPVIMANVVQPSPSYSPSAYCEGLLIDQFGATQVDSVDNNSYQDATYVHDLNRPLPQELQGQYETLIDGGTIEHVFNVPQALQTCSELLRPGGQILHILPANNYCGHGFWQFSPELFFSLYSARNGYRETEVFMADSADTRRWFQVMQPSAGQRVNVQSLNQVMVLVRTVRAGSTFSHAEVLQSDYVFEWEHRRRAPAPPKPANGLKAAVMRSPKLYDAFLSIYRGVQRLTTTHGMSERNPGLKKFDLSRLN